VSEIAKHISQARVLKRRVKLVGTADDVYKKGTGVCYDRDYGTAATNEGRRDNIVQKPSTTNHRWFAGVLLHTYTIPDNGEIWVEIAEPGSVCQIAIGQQSAVVATTRFGLSVGAADAGRFGLQGLKGRGGALALQTVNILCTAMDGSQAYTSSTKTVTDSGEFTGVVAGDTWVCVAGDAGTVGSAVVASRTDNTLVLATDLLGADAAKASGYALSGTGETLCLAYLEDGPESGCQEIVVPVDNTTFSCMVGGTSYIAATTLGTGNSTATIADGTVPGEIKHIECLGTMGTNDALASYTHHITSDPEVLYFDAVDEAALTVWVGGNWHNVALTAATS
jgi:hypothetical protein